MFRQVSPFGTKYPAVIAHDRFPQLSAHNSRIYKTKCYLSHSETVASGLWRTPNRTCPNTTKLHAIRPEIYKGLRWIMLVEKWIVYDVCWNLMGDDGKSYCKSFQLLNRVFFLIFKKRNAILALVFPEGRERNEENKKSSFLAGLLLLFEKERKEER